MPAMFKVTLLALASASLALALTDPGVVGRNNTPQAPHQERTGAGLEPSLRVSMSGQWKLPIDPRQSHGRSSAVARWRSAARG
jgi:hypothetical protein